jgi:carbonic anhydrase/acetyltransferase-like protein (isoleucine patch superfamily)
MKALSKYAAQGAGPTLIAELGAYVETDFARAVEFHIGKGRPITRFHDDHGPLAYWIVDAARVASEARLSVPLREALEIATPYGLEGYVNRMADAHDLRQLVIDAFLGRCTITPRGREIRPGVWIDEGVRLHKAARLVAPVYVGRNTRVEPAAVITRFSNLERECQVGEGSVVAHASVLAHTAIGRGLEVANAVVDGGEFVDLRRNIAVKIDDPNLIGEASGRMRAASQRRQSEEPGQRIPMPEPEYSYLARAAGRLFEAFTFKGEA